MGSTDPWSVVLRVVINNQFGFIEVVIEGGLSRSDAEAVAGVKFAELLPFSQDRGPWPHLGGLMLKSGIIDFPYRPSVAQG